MIRCQHARHEPEDSGRLDDLGPAGGQPLPATVQHLAIVACAGAKMPICQRKHGANGSCDRRFGAASFHAPVNGHRLGVRGGTVENRMSGLPRARGIACVQEFGGRPVVPHQQVSRRSDGSSSGRGSRRWPRGRPQDRGAAPAGVDRTVTPGGAEPMSSGSCFPSPVRGVEVHGTRVTSLREKGL